MYLFQGWILCQNSYINYILIHIQMVKGQNILKFNNCLVKIFTQYNNFFGCNFSNSFLKLKLTNTINFRICWFYRNRREGLDAKVTFYQNVSIKSFYFHHLIPNASKITIFAGAKSLGNDSNFIFHISL